MDTRKLSTLAEYTAEIEAVETELADIRGQLEKASAHQKATGQYADPEWYRKAKAALRYRGIEHQKLLQGRAALRREVNAGNVLNLERRFVEAARSILDEDLFYAVLREAQGLAKHDKLEKVTP